MTSVLLIAYPPAVRNALRARLSLERDLEIMGEADDAIEGINLAQARDPDVVLIDAETPDLDAAGIVHVLAHRGACGSVVVLSQHAAAAAAEVTGTTARIVGKHEGQAALVAAIRSAGARVARLGSF